MPAWRGLSVASVHKSRLGIEAEKILDFLAAAFVGFEALVSG